MGEYLREILTVLGSAFPEALLLTEEASGGFRTPCILVQKQELVLRQEMGKTVSPGRNLFGHVIYRREGFVFQ